MCVCVPICVWKCMRTCMRMCVLCAHVWCVCMCMCTCVLKTDFKKEKYCPGWDGCWVTIERAILQEILTTLNLHAGSSIPIRKVPEPLESFSAQVHYTRRHDLRVNCVRLPVGSKCSHDGFPSPYDIGLIVFHLGLFGSVDVAPEDMEDRR